MGRNPSKRDQKWHFLSGKKIKTQIWYPLSKIDDKLVIGTHSGHNKFIFFSQKLLVILSFDFFSETQYFFHALKKLRGRGTILAIKFI